MNNTAHMRNCPEGCMVDQIRSRGNCNTGPCGSVVEHPLRDREVVGSNLGRAIPKALKMVPVATLLGAQHYKLASTGFSSTNKRRTTIIATLTKSPKKKLSPIIINVCIHRRTVWKTGNYAKYAILLKYRDYYYYYYYYYYYFYLPLFSLKHDLDLIKKTD